MNKLVVTLLLFIFPGLVLADSSLSFTPPPSDYSMVFLSNLFGIVDGVLSGTGSQIMGTMFGVFNAAVLALGGIIIMYTLLVSTMNTAHEGQMLGQKWSSIWVPIRSTVGLALLIPKASGYCLMQIFVMWIIVQGVGAADKIWDTALGYLNRGGVVVQAQQNIRPQDMLSGGPIGEIATGATNILSGQVCMLGLQKQLETLRKTLLDQKANKGGSCYTKTDETMKAFCDTAVPDFLGSVNAVAYQNSQQNVPTYDNNGKQTGMKSNVNMGPYSLPMPNFPSGPYAALNGLCGTINWNSIQSTSATLQALSTNPNTGTNQTVGSSSTSWGASWDITKGAAGYNSGNTTTGASVTLTASDISVTQMSRAIAIQQMYMDLTALTRVIVNNDPEINKGNNTNAAKFSAVASQQFGVPYNQSGVPCPSYSAGCVTWGPTGNTGVGGGTLLNGNEFLNAISDYNGVMMPTLNLINMLEKSVNMSNTTAFIRQASAQGWIMAGSYFFDLVLIQGGSTTTNANQVDTASGLSKSSFDPNLIINSPQLGIWFDGDPKPVAQVVALIAGKENPKDKLQDKPTYNANLNAVSGFSSSTVYGLINNQMMIQLPGQPGMSSLTFANTINIKPDTTLYTLGYQQFSCGTVKILLFKFCLGQLLGNLFYNVIFLTLYNILMVVIGQLIQQIVFAFLMVPLTGMAQIFKQGVATLSQPGANPIVALATMGVNYINYTGNLWLILLNMAISAVILPPMFFVIMLVVPLIVAWASIMVSIGFVTAYYIPILPYMIFTFGAIGWLISVVEAMVAAPIVALGITHPEGHEAFGKGEPAIMILVNVFLRPSMMIIGYIAGIALSYVGVWVLNAGYDHAIAYLQQANPNQGTAAGIASSALSYISVVASNPYNADMPSGTGGYVGWSGIYAYFFSILIYTTMYLIIVQKAFTLISALPDRVLRWIGGSPESYGGEAAQWGEEVKQQAQKGGESVYPVQWQMGQKMGGKAAQGIQKLGGAGDGGNIEAQGSDKKPPTPPAGGK